jgi:hypothetical protein
MEVQADEIGFDIINFGSVMFCSTKAALLAVCDFTCG